MANVAIIGAGLIGRAWALVYARGGHRVRLWDSQPAQVGQALAFAREVAPGLAQAGLLRGRTVDQLLAALEPVGRMEDALRDADYVQESTPERLDSKRRVYAELDRLAPAGDPGQLDLGAAALAFHGRPAWPRALPGGASDQSAVPGAGRGNRAGALDRRRLRRASAQPVGRGRPAAHRDAARDRRLRRQPAAGRAAARGVPAGGRRLCRRRGRGHLHPRRFGAALGLHGPVRDHRPERPGRRARLRRTLRRHVRRDVRVHDPARALERRHAGPRRGAAPRAFARRRAGPAPDLARPAPDGTGRAQERLRQGRELP